jgi:choline dehydrogenase-like flavoprotein
MRTLRTRFLVIGSGAGGSVLAYQLARRGEPTLLLERGPWLEPKDLDHDELRMLGTLYKDGGTQTNVAGDMFVLQGNVVGGSTVLANGVCFRMPERVRATWASQGFEIPAADLAASYARVEAVLGVAPMAERALNPAALPTAAAAERLGLFPGRFRKNLKACNGCGYCNLGCPYGRKMDASRTWVPRAVEHGLAVLARHEARRVVTRRGRVECVIAHDLEKDEPVRIVAERTVLSGGAVNTPELLLRSSLRHQTAGRRTSFNVGSIMIAEMPGDVDAFRGDSMAWYLPGEGFVIEQVHNPPTTFALTLPGGPATHAGRLARYRRLVAAGVLVPTAPRGRVGLGRLRALHPRLGGRARIHFALGAGELAALRRGFDVLARLFFEAGAVRVFPPVHGDLELRGPEDLPRMHAAMRRQGDVHGFGSAHPQGGGTAGADPARSVVDGGFAVRGTAGLYVCDASVFPTSIEVNPQLTVMAVADHAVRAIGGFEPVLPAGVVPRAPAGTPTENALRLAPRPSRRAAPLPGVV